MATTTSPRSQLRKVAMRAIVPGAQPGAGETAQKPPKDPWTPSDALAPPLDLDHLAGLTMISPTRRSCLAAISLNTVGLGFDLEPVEGMEEDAGEDEATELARRLDACARRDRLLGRPSFTRLLTAAVWDKYEIGHGFIEVSRNRTTGEVDGLYHLPARRMRRKADRSGWVMGPRGGRGIELTHFYDFGEKVVYSEDGKPTPRLAAGATRWDRNEVIVLRLYTSQSRDYGLPPDASLAYDYTGDKLAAKSNMEFFDNSGVPPTVIFVQGTLGDDSTGALEVDVDQTFIEQVTSVLESGGSHSRVAVVPLPPGVDGSVESLAALSDRDVGFVAYRQDNRRRTVGAFRLSPIFVADIEDTNYSTATIERKLTKEQVFDPEQSETGDVLDQSLMRELAPHFTFKFAELVVEEIVDRRDAANDLADRGLITNGDYRAAMGYPPMPERSEGEEGEETDGKVPAGWNAQLVSSRGAALRPDEELDPEQMAKRGGLAGAIEDEFDRAIDEAVRAVSTMADGAELRPLVLEKTDDGRVLVTPYHRNGGSAE